MNLIKRSKTNYAFVMEVVLEDSFLPKLFEKKTKNLIYNSLNQAL